MIRCRIYSCDKYKGRPCCKDCGDVRCQNRCENSPERCKCSYESQYTVSEYSGPRPMSPKARRALILELHRKGDPPKVIAEKADCSADHVRYLIRVYGREGGAAG